MCRPKNVNQKELFGEAITNAEIESSGCKRVKHHPITNLLSESCVDSSGFFDCVKYNTSSSVIFAYCKNNGWFLKNKRILLSKDIESANSVFGEIRCYRSIAEVFGEKSVITVPCKDGIRTPDFKIAYGGFDVLVEVNTPQINGDEAKKLEGNDDIIRSPNERIGISERVIAPFGNVAGASLLHRVISKISGIKDNVDQLSGNSYTILWIDLQSEHIVESTSWIHNFGPYYSNRQNGGNDVGIYSNPLWYALFAPINTPIFFGQTLNESEGNKTHLEKMQFNAKFANDNCKNVSAVVYSGADSLIVCENPYAVKPLPRLFLKKLISLFRFNIENSFFSFPDINVGEAIKEDLRRIGSLAKEDFFSW